MILIPGTMGSRLVDRDKDEVIWGVFGPSNNPTSPGYAHYGEVAMKFTIIESTYN